jgi:hypothetical protein
MGMGMKLVLCPQIDLQKEYSQEESMDECNKTLTYRRAIFIVNGTGPLEQLLIQAHAVRPNIEHRCIEDPYHMVLECRDYKYKPGSGVFLHIAAFTPGEKASVAPRVQGVPRGLLQTTPPPDNTEFVDGDASVFVSGDHVIICSSSLHEKQAERYMVRIIELAGLSPQSYQFSITKIANADKVKMIQKQGVKCIRLDSCLYSATMDYVERTTIQKKLGAGIAEQLIALFKKDEDDTVLDGAENLNIRLSLSFDSRRKGAKFSRDKLEDMAQQLVDENEDGFSIETMSGESIKSDDVVLKKKVMLSKNGKSVHSEDTWAELESYYHELKMSGFLEQ